MSDLRIDLARLDSLQQDLTSIVKEFRGADKFSDDVAAATGHDKLAGKVRDFAHGWNRKRDDMTESVEGLVKALGAVTDGFTKVDKGLAKALEDQPVPTIPVTRAAGGRSPQIR